MATETDKLEVGVGINASATQPGANQAKAAITDVAKAQKELDKAFRALKTAIDPTYAAQEKYNKSVQDAKRLLDAGMISKREYTAGTRAAKAALNEEKEAITSTTAATRAATNEIKTKTRAQREAAAAAAAAARAERQSAETVTQMRASIDPTFAAQTRYNETMRVATQLLMQNKLATGEWTAIQRAAKTQMDLNVRSMGRMNSVYVQLGYQAQDVTASLASGINPLVILAQQGGQTAAALSMMGGTTGRIAAFFAGPWGAAIIGATLLLGLFVGQNRQATTRTLELRNAEDRRRMTLVQLTEAIRDFNREQREANNNSYAAQQIAIAQAQSNIAELERRRTELQGQIADLRSRMNDQNVGVTEDEMNAAAQRQSQAAIQLGQAEEQLGRITAQLRVARQGLAETQIADSTARAEAATDAANSARRAFEVTELQIQNDFRRGLITRAVLENRLAAAIRTREAAIEAANAAERESNRQARDTARWMGNPQNTRFISPITGSATPSGGQRFGAPRNYGRHVGEDLGGAHDVRAPAVGVVQSVGFNRETGNYVVLSHGAGTTTRYLHLESRPNLQVGQTLQQGEVFGRTGNTGNTSRGRHLHYEVRINGRPVDPSRGIFPTDTLRAQEQGLNAVESAAARALRVQHELAEQRDAELQHQQAVAGEDYREVLRLQDERIRVMREGYGAESEQATRALRERVLLERRFQQQIVAETRAAIQQRRALTDTREGAANQVGDIQRQSRRAGVDNRAQMGVINERQAALERAAILDEEYRDQVEHEDRMYTLQQISLRAELAIPNLALEQRRQILDQLESLEAEHLARRQVAQAQYAANVEQVNREAAARTMQAWNSQVGSFTSGLNTAFQGLWNRSLTISDALLQMADQQVFRLVQMGTDALQNFIMQQIAKRTIHQASEAEQTASTAAGVAARTGIIAGGGAAEVGIEGAVTGAKVAAEGVKTGAALAGKTAQVGAAAAAGVAEITTDAAVSAAGAFKSTVVIPFIGPVAAPAAAALALATVLGFAGLVAASAKGGQGRVPYDGQITELHKDEMVLPAWIAKPLRDDLRVRTSGGIGAGVSGAANRIRESSLRGMRDAIFHYSPTHNNGAPTTLESLLRRDAGTFRKWIRKQMKENRLEMETT